ncbi:inositol-pentakisphosphate 2-kinase-like isoform X2 [Rhododendron vialii]|uniref:inositol-pentakisphosphate 2-kinase-like isoform X2 n=1 Tax=Rhododendron vialii TaxID=182163 RepID=UPI00265D99E3|nr:inositol-pentakisphosphate 2-kinase-like isoform X2 [Rhododendron vialii]
MEVVLELKDADDWIYRGEGAANLVLAYSGSSPTFVGKVLRIQKAPRIESPRNGYDSEDSHSALTNDECLLWRETEDLVSAPTREIAEQLIVSFCPRNFSRRLKRISFPSVLLSELMQPWSTLNVILRFLCLIIQFFRMISEISEYNPLDLFSGSKDRMHKAIKALFVTPQNNFRVFLNGSLILGGLGGGADSTSCMIGKAFENVLNGVIQADGCQRTLNFLHLVTEAISGSGLLDQLLEVQKLDNIDIEGAIHAYYNLVCQPCIACRDLGGEKLSARYTNLHSMSSDESLKIVRDYLIAATAKDLSLMISFRTREDRDVELHIMVYFSTQPTKVLIQRMQPNRIYGLVSSLWVWCQANSEVLGSHMTIKYHSERIF